MTRLKPVLLSIILLFVFCASKISAQQLPAAAPSPTTEAAELAACKASLAKAESRLKDWPQLARYAAKNTEVKSPEKSELRVVFMGDSITDIWSRDGSGGFFPGKPYINRGISAQTTPQMLVRFRPDVIDLKPQVVVILAGTNDLAAVTGPETIQAIENNLTSMAELADTHGIHVVFASVLPISDYNRNARGELIIRTTERPPAQIIELNNWMRDYAAKNGHTYLDYYSAVVDGHGMLKADLARDGLHPNPKGYAIMAPLAEEAIARAMKSKR